MPLDNSVIEVTDPNTNTPHYYIYNAAIAKWQDIYALTINSEAPLSESFEEAVKNMLAVILCSDNSIEPTKQLNTDAAMGKLAIASKYKTVRPQGQVSYM